MSNEPKEKNMMSNAKSAIKLLVGFLPWIVFGILPVHTQPQLDRAIIIAFVVTIIFNFKELKKRLCFSYMHSGFLFVCFFCCCDF